MWHMNEPRYTIMTGAGAEELAYAVNEAIASGWLPQGGVTVTHRTYEIAGQNYYETEWTWAQAMVTK